MKKIIYLICAALLLIIIGFGSLFFLVDPNQLKPTIADQVKKATGRELVINGDMSWKIFPRIGFSLGETALRNPPGFKEKNTIQFSNAELDIALLPLLSHRLEIGNINLNNAHIFVQTLADGRSNMDGLVSKTQEKPVEQASTVADKEKSPWDIVLQGISLTDASATIRDDKTGDLKTISKLNLQLDHFSPGQWSKIAFSLLAKSNETSMDASGETAIFITTDLGAIQLKNLQLKTSLTGETLPKKRLDLSLKADASYDIAQSLLTVPTLEAGIEQIVIKGKASFKDGHVRQIRFNMSSDDIDLDQLLGMKTTHKQQKKPATPQQATPLSDEEPDLTALKNLDLAGTLAVNKFKANGVHISDALIKLKVDKGIAEISSLTANLYKGSIKATAKVNGNKRPATYLVQKEIVAVEARPLLMDLADIDMLEGKARASVNVQGRGLSPKKIRSNIKGSVDLQFADGAIHGVNIPKMLREAAAILKGKAVDEQMQAEQKTDFSSMGMTLNLAHGLGTTNNLALISPLLTVKGEGRVNLLQENLNFLLKTALAKNLQGEEAEEFHSLRGQEVPIKITGSWQAPQFSLSLDEIVKEKAKQELKRGLEKVFGGDQEGETESPEKKFLQGLFN